jgi:hypothetical protein
VECHITAAIALEYFDSALGQKLGGGEDVLRMGIAPQSDDRCVLKKEKHVFDSALLAQCHQLLLETEAGRIVNRAELEDGDHKTCTSVSKNDPFL